MILRDIVYDIRERLKTTTVADSKVTDEYLIHLINVKRSFLLKQKYSDIRKHVPDSFKQEICVSLELVDAIEELACEEKILTSEQEIPELLNFGGILGINKIISLNRISIPFNYVTMSRLPYVGHNKWLANQVYCSIGANKKLFFKAGNTQYQNLEDVRIVGLFANPEEALPYMCDYDCEDILDMHYPIEQSLIHFLIGMVLQDLGFRESVNPELTNNAKESSLNAGQQAQSEEPQS